MTQKGSIVNNLTIRPLGYALGAEVSGIDLAEPLDGPTFEAIHRAWLEHSALCFRDQDLTPRGLRDFCLQFSDLGELDRNEWKPQSRDPEVPEILVVQNKPVPPDAAKAAAAIRGDGVRGTFWHSDLSFSDRPATATLLLAKTMPAVGGNTMFSNMYLAYEALSPAMQQTLGSLRAIHRKFDAYDPSKISSQEREQLEHLGSVVHPVIRTHPDTGRKAIYFVPQRIRRFVGYTEDESRPFIAFLEEHLNRPEFAYRHTWRVNDLMMWDNRCTLHRVVPDYDPSQKRRLIRCSFVGPKTGERYDEAMEATVVA